MTGRLPLGNTAKQSKARLLTCLVVLGGISGCSPKQDDLSTELVRGLRAYKVAAKAEARVRQFASLLQPAEVSRLSFEIPGQLRTVSLEAGQRVQIGDLLAEIDPRSLQAQLEQANAGCNRLKHSSRMPRQILRAGTSC